MITGDYTFIRGTEHDDVPALAALYRSGIPRAGLLDGRREPLMPTADELRDLLSRKEVAEGAFYTVEDRTGAIRGFCSLRGVNPEARHCEFSLLLLQPASYREPLADEAGTFLLERAFVRYGLRRVTACCLAHEREFAAYLRRHGFDTAGVQRDVLHAGGQWHDLETFSRANAPVPTGPDGTLTHALSH